MTVNCFYLCIRCQSYELCTLTTAFSVPPHLFSQLSSSPIRPRSTQIYYVLLIGQTWSGWPTSLICRSNVSRPFQPKFVRTITFSTLCSPDCVVVVNAKWTVNTSNHWIAAVSTQLSRTSPWGAAVEIYQTLFTVQSWVWLRDPFLPLWLLGSFSYYAKNGSPRPPVLLISVNLSPLSIERIFAGQMIWYLRQSPHNLPITLHPAVATDLACHNKEIVSLSCSGSRENVPSLRSWY